MLPRIGDAITLPHRPATWIVVEDLGSHFSLRRIQKDTFPETGSISKAAFRPDSWQVCIRSLFQRELEEIINE